MGRGGTGKSVAPAGVFSFLLFFIIRSLKQIQSLNLIKGIDCKRTVADDNNLQSFSHFLYLNYSGSRLL